MEDNGVSKEKMKERRAVIQKFLVSVEEDGTESKQLIEEIFSKPVPTTEELRKESIRFGIAFYGLYIIIMALIMYYCFKLVKER